MVTPTQSCPCCSGSTYARCCEPYLLGKKAPETAEKLMRSRFSAYAVGLAAYLAATTAAAEREKLDMRELKEYCRSLRCLGLEILSTRAGGPEDEVGEVTFRAKLVLNGRRFLHKEHSRFVREDGRWVYRDGDVEAF
jgi:SEC-C motif-containing protein